MNVCHSHVMRPDDSSVTNLIFSDVIRHCASKIIVCWAPDSCIISNHVRSSNFSS